MPVPISPSEVISYLQRFLTHNKARGMVAELALNPELGINGSPVVQKLLPGGWLLSPKAPLSQYYRYLVSILPYLYTNPSELQNAVDSLQQDRGWQALATFMTQSGIGIIVSGAWSDGQPPYLDNLNWQNFVYHKERLLTASDDEPFVSWPGGRGRAGSGSQWQSDVLRRFGTASSDALTELVMRQAFFYGYLKARLRKPVDDPYDVDAFIVGFTGTVMPVEIKEKSPTNKGDFGIDAGRILMLLRLCLATDSNALYVIREVDDSPTRELVGWRCITLSDMVIGCRWNLQAGGIGMGGGATQTVMISGDLFEAFSRDNFSEDWIAQNKSLQGSIRTVAADLAKNLSNYLSR